MILPDYQIHDAIMSGHIGLDPYDPLLVQPASIDVRLGEGLLLAANPEYNPRSVPISAVKRDVIFKRREVEECPIHSGNLYLATMMETLTLPADIAGQLMGKSSLGRIGLTVHVTAGWLDPGFSGQITLEIVNHNPRPIQLTVGMSIAQICFMRLAASCNHVYSGRYQGQKGVTKPR